MKRPLFSLSKKALLAVAVILLPILVTFIYGYNNNRKILERHILEDLRLNSGSMAGRVFQFVEMNRRRVADFASDSAIREGVERAQRTGKRSDAEALGDYIRTNKLPLDSRIHSIEVIAPDGRVLVSTNGRPTGMSVTGEAFFLNFKSGKSITETLIDHRAGAPGLAVSAWVKGPVTAEPIAVMTQFVFLSELDEILKTAFTGSGFASGSPPAETMEAYLVNVDGLMITGSRFLEDAVLKKTVRSEPVSRCMEAGGDFSGFYADYRGVEVAGSSRCIETLNWALVVEIDSDEALAGVASMRRDALAAAAVVAGLIALLFTVFYRKVILQISRLSGAAASLSGGDYNVAVPVASNDELGALCESFNSMAARIKETNRAIRASEARYSTMLQTANDAIVTIDSEGLVTGFNATAERFFGYGHHEVLGKNIELLMPERYRAAHRSALMRVVGTGGKMVAAGKTREFEALRKDGTEFPISLTMSPAEVDGKLSFLGIIRDMTERRNAEEALRASEGLMKMAQRIAHLGSWDWDIINNTLVWSDEIYRIFGLKPDSFGATYEAFLNSVHPEDRQTVIDAVNAALYEKKPYSIDHRVVLPDGSTRVVHEQADVTFDSFGAPVRMVGTVQDLTEQKLAEYELKKLSMAIEQSVNIVFITDLSGVIEYVNPVFEAVTGYTKEEALGKTPRILSSSEVPRQKYEQLWGTILSGKTWRDVLKNRKKDGGFFWVSAAISPIKNEKGEITHFLSVQEDITDKMASEERIRHLVNNDELTGLVNRTRFMELLSGWIRSAESTGECGALCFIDIDQFKVLNDSLGHGVGDEFLRRMALLFKAVVEHSYGMVFGKSEIKPFLSRLSGDEFAVFLPSADAATGIAVMEELRSAVEAFHFTEHGTSSSVSIGVVLFPEHGASTRELFTRADAAMYRAKDLGRNRCHLFRPEDRDLEKMHWRLSWKDKILKALKEDRFEPWFQPILDLSDDTVRHYEVLARMRDEDGSILMPGSFIDIAERFGLVGLIDRKVIQKAMEIQAEMSSQGKDLSFSLNLSGKDLNDEDLLTYIKDKIQETGADPSRIVFEITETAAISDLERAIRFIKALKALGCRFALDDFGVGFTSFTYLKEMQVDYVKIDGSFIRKLHENPDDQVFVKAITDVARGLNIKAVAEFVETMESLKLLRKFRVDYAQGYLIGKPGPALAARIGHDLKNIKNSSPLIRAISGDD